MLKQAERLQFRRDKVRSLWVYRHRSIRDITEILNSDPEVVRKCGRTSHGTVMNDLKKIKAEFENNIDSDGLERYTAEFQRSCEFQDGEISDITKLLEEPDLKMDDRIKLIGLRHRIEIDKMTLLSDREIPLTVKKYKKDRAEQMKRLKTINTEDDKPLPDLTRLADRVRPE